MPHSCELQGEFRKHYNAGESQALFVTPIISQPRRQVHGAGRDRLYQPRRGLALLGPDGQTLDPAAFGNDPGSVSFRAHPMVSACSIRTLRVARRCAHSILCYVR